jgi:hypothetical protein
MRPLSLLGILLTICLSFAPPAFAGQLENEDSTQEACGDDKDEQAIGLDDSGEVDSEAGILMLNLISIMAQILAR